MHSSWTALHAYRTGRNLLSDSEATAFGPPQDLPLQTPQQQSRQPLRSVLPALLLSPPLDSALRPLNTVSRTYQPSWAPRSQAIVPSSLRSSTSQLAQILTTTDIPAIDLQFSCALLAYCLQLYRISQGQSLVTESAEPALPALSEIADTFLYQKLGDFSASPAHTNCLTWSALVLGSFLSQQFDYHLRGKGHIVHVSLGMRLNLSGLHDPADDYGWSRIASGLEGTMSGLWHPDLVQQWRNDWVGSMRRQREWETHGLLKIGVPRAVQVKWERASCREGSGRTTPEGGESDSPDVDIIEYLVLRDARDSLPRI